MMRRQALIGIGALGAAGAIVLAQAGPGSSQATAGDASHCPVYESRNWNAWINAEPGPDATPRLIVTGEVDLPTPGFKPTWRVGPADRRLPPAQYLDLSFTPPDGMLAQVITSEALRFETPAVYPEYRAVIVRCGGKTLATISPVPIAR